MKKAIAFVLAMILVLGLFAGCGNSDAQQSSPASSGGSSGDALAVEDSTVVVSKDDVVEKLTPEDTLVVGTTFSPTSLYTVETLATSNLETNPVYEPLILKSWETGEFEPLLATSWEFLDDCTLKITIRGDVYFHNGEHMTTEDVYFTLSKLANSMRWGSQYNVIDIEKCEIIDETTMTIVTKAPYGPLLNYLASPTAGILCKSWCEAVGDDALVTQTNGTGPFVMDTWTQGANITYNRNENYWGEKPSFGRLQINFYSDATMMFVDYETGALDVAMCVSDTDAQRVLNGEVAGSNIVLNPACLYAMCFWDQGEHFSDVRVRKAIAHALDVDALTYVGFGILAEVSESCVAPYCSYYTPVGTYEYDPELAKELLAEAGYPDGFEIRLCHNTEGLMKKMAEAVQQMLGEVGIKVTLECYEQTVLNTMLRGTNNGGIPESEWQLWGLTPSTGDPDQLYTSFKSNSADTLKRSNDPQFIELIESAALTSDEAEREALYAQFQQYVYDNCAIIPFCVSTRAFVYRNYIDAFDTYAPYVLDLAMTTFK